MRGHVRYRLVRGPLRPAILATNIDSSASMRSDTPESRFPLFHSHPNHVDTFNFFDFFNLDIFDFCRLLLKIQQLTIFVSLARVLPLPHVQERNAGGGAMPLVLKFIRKWNKWYRVLRYRKGFGPLDSVRYGLWLAHS